MTFYFFWGKYLAKRLAWSGFVPKCLKLSGSPQPKTLARQTLDSRPFSRPGKP